MWGTTQVAKTVLWNKQSVKDFGGAPCRGHGGGWIARPPKSRFFKTNHTPGTGTGTSTGTGTGTCTSTGTSTGTGTGASGQDHPHTPSRKARWRIIEFMLQILVYDETMILSATALARRRARVFFHAW